MHSVFRQRLVEEEVKRSRSGLLHNKWSGLSSNEEEGCVFIRRHKDVSVLKKKKKLVYSEADLNCSAKADLDTAHVRTDHDGLPQKRLEENLCRIAPETQFSQGTEPNRNQMTLAFWTATQELFEYLIALTAVHRQSVTSLDNLYLIQELYGCQTSKMLPSGSKRKIQAFETKCLRKLLRTSHLERITNDRVRNKINFHVGQQKQLLTTGKRRQLKWFRRDMPHDSLSKTVLQGTWITSRLSGQSPSFYKQFRFQRTK